MTHEEAGRRMGCAPQTVGKLCAKHEIRCHRRGPRSGPGHPNWKGGRNIDRQGYVMVWVPDHPHARKQHRVHAGGYVLEHRLVMEAHLGRYLEPHEVVHHKDGNRQNNALENLEVFDSNAEHLRHELTGQCPQWTAGGEARIRAGVERSAAKRRKPRGPGDPPLHRRKSHPRIPRGTEDQDP